jgi:hypothetical protein
MTNLDSDFQDKVHAWIGTAMLASASIFAILIFSDRMDMSFISLPAVWYSSRSLHLVFCGMMFLAAAILLKSPMQIRRTPHAVFSSCRLLTRADCGLCEEAMHTLMSFQDYLPSIQIVDIERDPVLVRQFGESIPVVEIDGRVRFRGAVSATLLKRMIDAALLRELQQPVELMRALPEHRFGCFVLWGKLGASLGC